MSFRWIPTKVKNLYPFTKKLIIMRGAKNVFMTETPRPRNPVHLSVAAQQQQTLSDPNLSCLSRVAHPIPPQKQGSTMPFHPAGIRLRVKGLPQFPWLARWVWGHPRITPRWRTPEIPKNSGKILEKLENSGKSRYLHVTYQIKALGKLVIIWT